MTNTTTRIACACLIMLASSAMSAGAQQSASAPTQTPAAAAVTPSPGASTAASPETRTSAGEDFELNIGERRITEENFEASTEVEVGDGGAGGVNLRVGVAASAEQIDVLLRNVRGRVRFRASLEDVLRRLGLQRRADAPTTPPPP